MQLLVVDNSLKAGCALAILPQEMKHLPLSKYGLFLALTLSLFGANSFATRSIEPVSKLAPLRELKPKTNTDCAVILSSLSQIITPDVKAAIQTSFTKSELLNFVNFLTERRFRVTSLSLSQESDIVKALLYEKFGIALSGNELARKLKPFYATVGDAVRATREGKKLDKTETDADWASWSPEILIRLAQEAEKFGVPFDEETLKKRSSFVGMKLAEKYGYPVPGDVILRRAVKLGLSIGQIRKKAGLPKVSTISWENLSIINWTPELITQMLKILQANGFPLVTVPLYARREEVTNLLFKELKIRTTVSALDNHIQVFYGNWPEAKKTLGITYDGRARYEPGRPDWTKEFYIEILRFIKAKGFEPSHTLFEKDKFEPVRILIQNELGYIVSGKSMYERGAELFGTSRAAYKAAGIPYVNQNEMHLGTHWKDWPSANTSNSVNPITHVEILKFIDSLGITPNEESLLDEDKFASLKADLVKHFGIDIDAQTILQNSRRLFGSHYQALKAAEVKIIEAPEWTPEFCLAALKIVMEKFPNLNSVGFLKTHTQDIGNLLKEKMGVQASGASLYGYLLEFFNGYLNALDKIDHKQPWRVTVLPKNKRESLSAGTALPSKEVFDQVIQHIFDLGYTVNYSLFKNATNFVPVADSLEAHFGFRPSMRSILEAAKEYYGKTAFLKFRKVRSLPLKKSTIDWTPDYIIKELETALKNNPDIKADDLGTTLHKQAIAQFGDIKSAFEKTGVSARWSRNYTPTKDELSEALKIVATFGQNIGPAYLRDEKLFAPAAEALKNKFGYQITGQALYSFSFKLYGQDGLNKALRAAGIEAHDIAQWTPEFTLEVFKFLVEKYPRLDSVALNNEDNSNEIGFLLKEKYGIQISAKRVDHYAIQFFGGADEAFDKIGHRPPWTAKYRPTKELYIQVLQFIEAQGYQPKIQWMMSEDGFSKVAPAIKAQFGFQLTGGNIVKYGKELFGSYRLAVRAAGVNTRGTHGGKGYNPGDALWTPEFTLQALAAVIEQFPFVSHNSLALPKDQAVREILKKKFNADYSSQYLLERIKLHFGSLGNAFEKLNYKVPWPKIGPPTKEFYIEVIKFLDSKGIEASSRDLIGPDKKPDPSKMLEEHFGVAIYSKGIYDNGILLFGSMEAARAAAGIKRRGPPAFSEIKTKELFIDVLKYINTLGYIPTSKFMRTKDSFDLVKDKIQERFQFETTGAELAQGGYDLFGTFPDAFVAAGLLEKENKPVWTREFLLQALRDILSVYPNFSANSFQYSAIEDVAGVLNKKYGFETNRKALYKEINKEFGSFQEAMDLIGNRTPWMITHLKTEPIDKDTTIKYLQTLFSIGIIPKTGVLLTYSDVIAMALYEKFGVEMRGLTLVQRCKELFPDGGVDQALKNAGVNPEEKPSLNARSVAKILKFVEDFGFSLSDTSLAAHSDAIGWAVFIKYGILANGISLQKFAREYLAAQKTKTNFKTAKVLEVNDISYPIILKILKAAGLNTRLDDLEVEFRVQIQNLMKYHFKREVNLRELKLYRMGE